jgi:hypothetical protein
MIWHDLREGLERNGLRRLVARGRAEMSLGDGKRLRDQSMEVGLSDESFQTAEWPDRGSTFCAS